jgi:NAD+ kinase
MDVKAIIGFAKDDRFSHETFQKFYELASQKDLTVVSSKHTTSIPGIPQQNSTVEDGLLVIFGGDGTTLRALKMHPGLQILGINCGSFGFLCEFEANEIEEALEFISNGDWISEATNVIQGTLKEEEFLGINECVISGADTGRPVDLRIQVDGVTMFEHRGDGMIISTPNGSTAYNIASGGAIISPTLKAIALTPIAPFLTLDRSVILPSESKIEITNLERTRSCKVFYDGVMRHELGPGDNFLLQSSTDYSIFLRRKGSFSRRMARKISNRYPRR